MTDRTTLAAALVLVGSLAPDAARAVDPRSFDPPVSGAAIVGFDTTRLLPAWTPFVSLSASLADDEVDGVSTRFVSHLAAGLTLVDALELGVGLAWHEVADARGPGDLHAAVKLRLTQRDARWGAALAVTVGVPLGDLTPTNEDGVTLDPRLVLDWRGEDMLVALALGYRHRPVGRLGAIDVGGELRFGLGVEGRVARHVSFVSELDGGWGLEAASRALPLEARLGARLRVGDWALTAAAGTRLTQGYGAPDARLIVALAFAPSPLPSSPVVVARAAPAFAPPPPVDLELVRATDPDGDGDRISIPYDRCPDLPEDVDGVADGDGCPDAEATPAPAAGYELGPDGRLVLPGVIEFRSGSDVLLAETEDVLLQVARFLIAHPEIARVRIEGHTDDQGDEEENVDLSERRAASVRRALVTRGVAADRLLPKGYGKTRPLAANTDAATRKQNRRVELRVVAPDDDGGAP